MVDIYAMPNETVTSVTGLVSWAATTSDGLLFPGILFVIGVIAFLATKQFPMPVAFATASFMVAILSIVITVAGWMSSTYMYFAFFLVGVSFVALRMSNGGKA